MTEDNDIKTSPAPEKGEPKPAEAGKKDRPKKNRKPKEKRPKDAKPVSLRRGAVAGVVIASLAVGCAGTYAMMMNHVPGKAVGTVSVTKDNYDSTKVASYTWNGKTYDVTAKEVLTWSASSADKDGKYDVPDGQVILSYVQAKVLQAKADEEGVSVSNDEVDDYMKQQSSSASVSDMAKSYGVSKDEMYDYLKGALKVQKLQDKVIGEAGDATAPDGPGTPKGNDYDKKTSGYADYIVKLAKSMGEWDSDKDTFKDGSAIGKAVGDDFKVSDGASYNDAAAAYYAAYQEYAPKAQTATSKWSDYQNNVFKDIVLVMYGIEA